MIEVIGMRSARTVFCMLIGIGLLAANARGAGDPAEDPEVMKTLLAMSKMSTWHHPDQWGMTAGMRAYAHRRYGDAMKYFEVGAQYADKLSQLSIGLMYKNGEGVAKDPVMAYAWMDLACERGYPQFVATRDELKETLTPAQLARAESQRTQLAKRYADEVAQPRMVFELKQAIMQMTGSLAGYDAAGKYPKKDWDPALYFATRDREWKNSVTVGPVEEVDPPATAPKQSDNSDKP